MTSRLLVEGVFLAAAVAVAVVVPWVGEATDQRDTQGLALLLGTVLVLAALGFAGGAPCSTPRVGRRGCCGGDCDEPEL
jgi:hypothetical protein